MIRSTILVAAGLALATGCQSEKRAEPASATQADPSQAEPSREGELLRPGDAAPDFETVAHDGTAIRSKALAGQPAVVYFYPKDETPG